MTDAGSGTPGGSPVRAYLEARESARLRPTSAGGAGLQLCHALSDALDASLGAIFAEGGGPGIALVAVGGYGRREQSRHSDVDLMVLLGTEQATPRATRLLYPLWDARLKVGHSVRTVPQALDAARENVETLTALLDARLVAGDAALFEGFRQQFGRLAGRRLPALVQALGERRAALLAREPWQLQEAEIKTGRGGLRSLQAMRWLRTARAFHLGREIEPGGAELDEAAEVLFTARNALHALGERPGDRFLRDLAAAATAWIGEDRFECERRILLAMRTVDAAEAEELRSAAAGESGGRGFFGRFTTRRRSEAAPPPVEGSDADQLLAALWTAGSASLEPLENSPWLARLLPEWEVLRGLPHVAAFHRHPVDVHAWRSVEEAAFAMREDRDGTGTVEAAAALPDRHLVLLAALLHDIGKGHEGDHSEVGAVITERFAARAGLDPEAGQRLATAVRFHLLLPNVATRRDIADTRVIAEVAAAVRDPQMLNLLYVLSVADSRASGEDVWSPWKAQLMRNLYSRVLNALTSEQAEDETAALLRRRAEEALAGMAAPGELGAHLDALPVSYLLSTPPETIADHLALVREAGQGTAVRRDRVGSVDRLTVVTADRPGILSLVAGTLAVHNVNVLGGTAFTRDDGVAIEIMHVSDGLGHGIDDRRWARVLGAVPEALDGRFPLEERFAATRKAYPAAPRIRMETTVHVDNTVSERYTVVEVNTADRLGLLYVITRALRELSLDIHLAKVDTIGPEVVDAFYVQRRNGRRVEDTDEVERVQARVSAAVRDLDEGGD